MRLLRDKSGFTMMELLVAMIVIALGLLALSGLFPLGSRARMRGEGLTRAIELAQQRMERLVEQGYDSLYTNLHDSTYVRTYKVEWWVETIGWGPSRYDSLKVVTDTVTYLTPGGGRRKVGITTYLSARIARGG
jgi:prepilin-type N-terminal cleavage/methylation domain-containing protein